MKPDNVLLFVLCLSTALSAYGLGLRLRTWLFERWTGLRTDGPPVWIGVVIFVTNLLAVIAVGWS